MRKTKLTNLHFPGCASNFVAFFFANKLWSGESGREEALERRPLESGTRVDPTIKTIASIVYHNNKLLLKQHSNDAVALCRT